MIPSSLDLHAYGTARVVRRDDKERSTQQDITGRAGRVCCSQVFRHFVPSVGAMRGERRLRLPGYAVCREIRGKGVNPSHFNPILEVKRGSLCRMPVVCDPTTVMIHTSRPNFGEVKHKISLV